MRTLQLELRGSLNSFLLLVIASREMAFGENMPKFGDPFSMLQEQAHQACQTKIIALGSTKESIPEASAFWVCK
jgi:hypothetical protein